MRAGGCWSSVWRGAPPSSAVVSRKSSQMLSCSPFKQRIRAVPDLPESEVESGVHAPSRCREPEDGKRQTQILDGSGVRVRWDEIVTNASNRVQSSRAAEQDTGGKLERPPDESTVGFETSWGVAD